MPPPVVSPAYLARCRFVYANHCRCGGDGAKPSRRPGYRGYWDELVPRMRPGGIVLVDNTLLHGRIFAENPDPDALAIREFNEYARADGRVELVMLPVGDGLTVARTR